MINRKEYLSNPDLRRLRQGFSLLDMKRFVDKLGYQGEGFGQLSFQDLIKHAPIIVPVNLQGFPHFVVFRGATSRQVLLADPAFGRVTLVTDSGDTGGFEKIRGSLSAIKRQDPLTFVGGLSYEHTSRDGQIKPGTATSFNFGTNIALSPETSLSFLFAGTSQNETTSSGLAIAGSDRDIGVFVIGGSTLLARGTLLHFSTVIGLTDDAEDLTLMLSLLSDLTLDYSKLFLIPESVGS